jgi:hypothetical protein
MYELKEGNLDSAKTGTIVTKPKQTATFSLSEAVRLKTK